MRLFGGWRRVGKQIVSVPSFLVRVDRQKSGVSSGRCRHKQCERMAGGRLHLRYLRFSCLGCEVSGGRAQGGQADRERALVPGARGQPEAHRLCAQQPLRRRTPGPQQAQGAEVRAAPVPVNSSRGKNTLCVACKREQQKMHQVVIADMPACLPCNCYKACKLRGTHEIV